jgi:outer membrane protein, multidrug efflux system
MTKQLLSYVILLSLSSCAVMAPDYKRTEGAIAQQLPIIQTNGGDSFISVADMPRAAFILNDDIQQLIATALENNRNLRKTITDIDSARALYRVQNAAMLPTITGGVTGSKARNLSTTAGQDNAIIAESYKANLGMSAYEVDVFGRIRSLTDAALETYLATEEDERTTRISLVSEIINAYITLVADTEKLALTNQTIAAAKQSMVINQKRLDVGVGTLLEVKQAETIYQQANVNSATLLTAIAQDKNALTLLVGKPITNIAQKWHLSFQENGSNSLWLADVPVGLSSDILYNRPDVMAAEHRLKSANANIGAARAAFYPTISLTATGGIASSELVNLFSGVGIWSFIPSITMPIFNGGANKANLKYSEAQMQGLLASYEYTVQTAFKEVSDSLAVQANITQQLLAQQALVDAAKSSLDIANARYQKGVATYLDALDAQRTLYTAQQTLMTLKQTELQNKSTLYKALGGGAS